MARLLESPVQLDDVFVAQGAVQLDLPEDLRACLWVGSGAFEREILTRSTNTSSRQDLCLWVGSGACEREMQSKGSARAAACKGACVHVYVRA